MDKKEILEKHIAEFGSSRDDFFELLDELIPKIGNTNVFDFESCEDKNLKEIYNKFYHYDYAIRRILPFVYDAYDIKFEI